MTRGRAQDKAIEQLLRQNKLNESQELDDQLNLIDQRTQNLLSQIEQNN